jgi:peptidoglycan/LPS O-acetylase OafA/YrhL
MPGGFPYRYRSLQRGGQHTLIAAPFRRGRGLPPGFSAYLDLLRVLAAATVFLSHTAFQEFTGGLIAPLQHLAHQAVIAFFVLSGYVICFVAHERETDPVSFSISRFCRIYSVAVPALALTIAADAWLVHVGVAQDIRGYQLASPFKYTVLALGFATQLWFLKEDAFSNIPWWSLCYEVWYYVLFGVLFFARGSIRLTFAAMVIAIMGPKLWLLAPCWTAGAVVYLLHRRQTVRPRAARVVFVVSLWLAAGLWISGLDVRINDLANALSGGWMAAHLEYSQFALGDLLVAGIVALNMWAAGSAAFVFGRVGTPIRVLAGMSFTLYLMHFPLLEVWTIWLRPAPPVLMACVLATVALFSLATERQNSRLRVPLRRLASRLAPTPG